MNDQKDGHLDDSKYIITLDCRELYWYGALKWLNSVFITTGRDG